MVIESFSDTNFITNIENHSSTPYNSQKESQDNSPKKEFENKSPQQEFKAYTPQNEKDQKDSLEECSRRYLGVPESLRNLKNCAECQKITCSSLLFLHPKRNRSYYNEVKNLMDDHMGAFDKPGDERLLEVLEGSCEGYKEWRKYDISPPLKEELENFAFPDDLSNGGDEEKNENEKKSDQHVGNEKGDDEEEDEDEEDQSDQPYSIAFTILMHDNFQQAERLIRALYRPQHFFCVHVDKDNPHLVEQMKKLIGCFKNIYLAPKLENVIYRGVSRLLADIHCMREHVKRGGRWKYLLNTAASAFPIRTSAEMVQIFKIYNGVNDIVTIDTSKNRYLQNRFKYKYVINEIRGKKFIDRTRQAHEPPPHNLTVVKGSAYGAFSRAFVEFLVSSPIVADYLEWCKSTLTPDEHFWNTFHHTYSNPHINAPGGSTCAFFQFFQLIYFSIN